MNCFIVCFVAVSWAEGEPRPRPPLARSQSSYLSTDFEECSAPEGPAVEKRLPEVAARECAGDGAREHSFLNVAAARTTVTFPFSFRISGQRISASQGPHHFLFVSWILHLVGKS